MNPGECSESKRNRSCGPQIYASLSSSTVGQSLVLLDVLWKTGDGSKY